MQIILSDFQDQLVKGLSHRMNNILTLFHGYLGLLLDNEKLDPITQDGLAKIKDGARVATELMDRTNALVRPSHPAPGEIVLAEFLNQLVPSIEKIRVLGSNVEIHCAENVPLVWADPSRVRIALLELVKNACEATVNGGGVRISVTSSETGPKNGFLPPGAEQPSEWVTIAVMDEGAGFAKGIETRIYEPFATTKKRQAIAGLGLTVAMGCMQQVGGAIEHESVPGATTFRLILPARIGGEVRAVA